IGYSDSSFGKEDGGLPLFYETEEVETYLKIKRVLFKKIKHDSFFAIRPIRSPDRKVIGFSVVNFKTDKFIAPSNL
ncbi:hypothetical protein N9O57_01610, partial [bacterium]|nr:hypothetical protein [bacterium]